MGSGSSKTLSSPERIHQNRVQKEPYGVRVTTDISASPSRSFPSSPPHCRRPLGPPPPAQPVPAALPVPPPPPPPPPALLPFEVEECPIPLHSCCDKRAEGGVTLEDIIGPEGSHSKYIRRKIIGQGAYGEALIVQRNPAYDPNANPLVEFHHNRLSRPTIPGALYVAKIADLRQMLAQYRDYALTEFICLAHSNHFAIIKYFEHFILENDCEQMVLITELANHGDLHHNLICHDVDSQGNPVQPLRLTEREAGIYFVQILCGLHHIHRRRMIHRDVKSANLFVTSNGIMKLGDFGFSQKYESTVSSESVAGTFLGTPYYLSPEMWKGMRYGKRADVWAAGVVLYEMLMDGQRPFNAEGLGELREKVLSEDVVLPECPPQVPGLNRGYFSQEMRDLVQSIFVKNPKVRPSTEELLAAPVLQEDLCMLERHIHQLLRADDALIAANPNVDVRTRLNFPNEDDRALVLEGVQEAKMLSLNARKDSFTPIVYEGVVYKESQNGQWKERYLSLRNNVVTISLSKGKSAATGNERRKEVPIESILSTAPCTITAPSGADPLQFIPPYGFAVSMKSMRAIVFGLLTQEERDHWLEAVMASLQMD